MWREPLRNLAVERKHRTSAWLFSEIKIGKDDAPLSAI